MLAVVTSQATYSASDEKMLTGVFNIAHFALRPWPWIIVALCSMLVFPTPGAPNRQIFRLSRMTT